MLKQELGGLRTGRASPHLLDPIQVEAYGSEMPLTQVATVSVPEPRSLSIQVWDKSVVTAVDKAIRNANLGLNPQTEGQVMRLRIPELNSRAASGAGQGGAQVRRSRARRRAPRAPRRPRPSKKARRKTVTSAKTTSSATKSEVQKATDQAITDIDQMLAQKEKEILSV